MRAFGFSDDAIAATLTELTPARPTNEGLDIHPDNGPAMRLFLALQTQWRTIVLSMMSRAEMRRTGLDYTAIEPAARLLGLTADADVFARLRVLEAEALGAWAEAAQ